MNEGLKMSAAGLDLLKRSEGFRDRVYADLAGYRTIGYGHRLQPGEEYPAGIALDQGESILAADVLCAELSVKRFVTVPLTQGQFDALVDFVFNLGAGRLAHSSMLALLNARKYEAAAWQILAWDHVGTKEVAGLKLRREAEFNLWMNRTA